MFVGENLQTEIVQSGLHGLTYLYTTETCIFAATATHVNVVPNVAEDDAFVRAEKVAKEVLDRLSETPVKGLGFNFGFDVDEPSDELNTLLSTDDRPLQHLGLRTASNSVTRRVNDRDHLIVLSLSLAPGEPVRVDVNHHWDVAGAKRATDILVGNTFLQCRAKSIEIVSALYGVSMEST
ncbi:hypothetical protein WME76_01290 [Sorangium sp. So ce119]|uniref:hypothetical protein n=1 Tax=Sorangium sp. So ce119 TaxID=3133279 RepID=UPI003F5F7527